MACRRLDWASRACTVRGAHPWLGANPAPWGTCPAAPAAGSTGHASAPPRPADLLYIIKNDGLDPVTGQFAGLPQMSQFDLLYNGTAYKAQISYQGDYATAALTGGNDVVVALPEPATLSLLALGGLLAMRRRRSK